MPPKSWCTKKWCTLNSNTSARERLESLRQPFRMVNARSFFPPASLGSCSHTLFFSRGTPCTPTHTHARAWFLRHRDSLTLARGSVRSPGPRLRSTSSWCSRRESQPIHSFGLRPRASLNLARTTRVPDPTSEANTSRLRGHDAETRRNRPCTSPQIADLTRLASPKECAARPPRARLSAHPTRQEPERRLYRQIFLK